MDIQRAQSRQARKPSADYFTGDVSMETLRDITAPSRLSALSVSFQPGARTAWHTHPVGQTLIVTEGEGLAQVWGEAIQQIKPGDVVWFPAGEKHWHGAAPATAMTHIALQEASEGSVVEWMEHVSEDQYQGIV